jgi:endonuclease G
MLNFSKSEMESIRRKAEEAGVLRPPVGGVVDTEMAIPSGGPVGASFEDLARKLDEVQRAGRSISDVSAKRIVSAGKTGFALSSTDLERMIGLNDLVDEFYLERGLLAAKPVMRIVLRASSGKEIGYATGVMVSPRLLLTNHHVFPTASDADNAVIDAHYVLDIKGIPARSYRFRVRGDMFFQNNKGLDWALVAIEPISEDKAATLDQFGYHRLIRESKELQPSVDFLTLIQHPSGQPRQFGIRENQFLKYDGDFLWYKCDTAPGSSGCPVFNDAFQIVGLHHRGVPNQDSEGMYILKNGMRVKSLTGIAETDVDWIANAGVRISRICESFDTILPQNSPFTKELRTAMEGGDVMSTATGAERGGPPAVPPVAVSSPGAASDGNVPGRIQITVTIDGVNTSAQVSCAGVNSGGGNTSTSSEMFQEKMPVIERDYSGRTGFDTKFLPVAVPLPTLKSKTSVSTMEDGKWIIPYQNFSVVLNKKRRMAYFTAANIDSSKKAKQPEAGKDYTRDGLGGLKENDSETWAVDSRIPGAHQLPDRFYNKDRKAFDKGHIVQRDSVCWGKDYAQVQRANGDTYHVTNCSPQTSKYNQSAQGVDNWGDLENEILKQAKTEKVSVFAGPIFADNDPEFHGVDDFGPVVIQVPRKYWKVIIAEKAGKLQSFAFVLEQDLTNVEFEFFVPTAWKRFQVNLKDLQKQLGPVSLPKVVIDADQMKP